NDFSLDLRWRAIVLTCAYDIQLSVVATLLGISEMSLTKWYQRFLMTSNVDKKGAAVKKSRWPEAVCSFVSEYVENHGCFYLEELREAIVANFPSDLCLSDATFCRALRFDLGFTRKVLTKRARESLPREQRGFTSRLSPFYSGPDQHVFVDVTSSMSRSVLRRRGWSARNTPVNVSIPFSRGKRASVLAAIDTTGFFAWGMTDDTFTRRNFHDVFKNKIAPFLNPWPMPHSIVVLDNAKIHMYQELQDPIHATAALLFFPAPLLPRPESDRG
ncbi:hypothetical protein JG688_00014085, partial [Phytophthora aleatoria]